MRKSIEDRIDIDASHAIVWGVLSNFSAVATWAPHLRSSSPVGDVEAGVGAYRVMRHFWGFQLEESVVEWEEGRGYTFELRKAPYPIKDVRESWYVSSEDDRVSVTTRVEYDTCLGPLGDALDAMLVSRLVRREMRGGLEGLRRYAETVTGRPSEVADGAAIE